MKTTALLLLTVAVLAAAAPAAAHDAVCGMADRGAQAQCHRDYVRKAGSDRYDVRSGHGHYEVKSVRGTWAMCGPNSFCGSFVASYVKPGLPGGVQECGRIKVRVNAHDGRGTSFRQYQNGRWVRLTSTSAC